MSGDQSIGPVQLLVLGFDHPDFRGEIVSELARLRQNGAVAVIDVLVLYKDVDGEFEIVELGGSVSEPGSVVAALVGLGIEGEEEPELGAAVPEPHDGWDVLDDIPRDTAAALLLLEHHWAVPLRDAMSRAGGYRIGDGFISSLDLAAIGLVSAEEAAALHAIETGAV